MRAELNFQRVTLDDGYFAYERDVGDIDGDGDNDIVCVQEDENNLQVFKAPEWARSLLIEFTGTFAIPRADDLKVADMDNDGDVDVILRLGPAPQSEAPGLAVWCENLGGGTNFVVRDIGASPDYVKDIVVVDLDGDAQLDVVMRMTSQTQVWLRDSIASNTWSEVLLSHPAHEGLEAGDVDMDGDPDLVMNGFWFATPDDAGSARTASNYVYTVIDDLWFNQGAGTGIADSCKVVVGDFNSDGTNDVALSHSERPGFAVTWYESPTPLQPGTWLKHEVTVVDYCHNLQATDWDLDGDIDLLVGGMVQSQHRGLKLELNDGTGTNWTELVLQSEGSYSAEMGDIDEDGDMDIVGILSFDQPPTYFYRNNTTGSPSLDFWHYERVSDTHARTFGLCFPNVDGDGDLDIASGPFVYINPGSAMTGTWIQVPLPNAVHAFATLDVDGDERVDIIAQKNNAGNDQIDLFWVEAADATGTSWSTPVLIGGVPLGTQAEGFQGYAVGQLVAGGRDEIAVNAPQDLYYFQVPATNLAAGNWPRILITTNVSEEGIDLGDMDGDGDLDIGFTDAEPNRILWARNPGDGSSGWDVFGIGGFLEATYPDRCEVADFNSDGRLDIAVTEENFSGLPDAVAYWWEQPPGGATNSSWTPHLIATQYTMNSMDVADLDQDGDVDIVLGEHQGSRRIGVWENDGLGDFLEHNVDEGRESHLGGRLADLDQDGDLDLVSIAFSEFSELHLWRNDSPVPSPLLLKSVSAVNALNVRILFNQPVEADSAQTTTNYTLNHGVQILSAILDGESSAVTLATSPLPEGITNILTVSHVKRLAQPPETIADGSQASFVYIPDRMPPGILGVVVNDAQTLSIQFDEPLDRGSAELVGNYSINKGIVVSAAFLQPDARIVRLSVSSLSDGSYLLSISGIGDLALPPNVLPANTTVPFTYRADPVPPAIESVAVIDPYNVRIVFTEPVDPVSAQTPTNYVINNGVTLTWAILGEDQRSVTLATSQLPGGVSTVTVNHVKDLASPPNTIAVDARADFSFFPTGSRTTAGLIALYGFEEGSGTIAHDLSAVGTPFDLQLQNPANIQWLNSGGNGIEFLAVGSAVGSSSAATKLYSALTASNAFTMEAWVTPQTLAQNGPARILTLSQGTDTSQINAQLGQENGGVSFRVRTATDSLSVLDAGGVFSDTTTPCHLAATYDGSVLRLYVNGVQNPSVVPATGNLSDWNTSYPLVGGNEATLDRSWLGTLYLMAVYSRALSGAEIETNHGGGPALAPPPDSVPPAVMAAVAREETSVRLLFSEPVTTLTAQAIAHYSIDNGAAIIAAVLEPDMRTVRLSTSLLQAHVPYTLLINNVADQAPSANVILPDTAVTFAYQGTAPQVLVPGLQVMDEDTTLVVNLEVNDDDGADQVSLRAVSMDPDLAPEMNLVLGGSAASPSLTITPASDQYGATTIFILAEDSDGNADSAFFSLVVLPVNDAPVLASLPDVTLAVGKSLSLTNRADDPDLPPDALTYQLITGPAGAIITSNGVIQWVAGLEPSTNVFTTAVTDDGVPPLAATNSFKVTVTWGEFRIVSVVFTNGVSAVTWNAVPGSHYRLQCRQSWGQNPWIDVPGVVTAASALATHSHAAGSLAQHFYRVAQVEQGNSAPVLDSQPDRVVLEGQTLWVTNRARDWDVPANALNYRLIEAPAGAAIAANGLIDWVAGPGPSTNALTSVVTDDGAPPLSSTNSFKVIVVQLPLQSPPAIESIGVSDGTIRVAWKSVLGVNYRLQSKDALTDTEWMDLGPILPGSGSVVSVTNWVGAAPQRFYRVVRFD